MNNLSKTIKKVLGNKNTVTIIGVLLCIIVLYIGYNMRINQKTKLVKVYYAKETIQPKTQITEDMIGTTELPEAFLTGDYYKSLNEINGKYSNYNSIIPAGSLFYKAQVVKKDELPDSVLYGIEEENTISYVRTDVERSYGNVIMPTNYVDVYVKMTNSDGKIVYGKYMENLKVLSVKNSEGQNVFENTDNVRTPSYIYFAMPEAEYLTFTMLKYLQEEKEESFIEIVLVPNGTKYEDTPNVKVSGKYITDYIMNNIEKIDYQDELFQNYLARVEENINQLKENN